MFCVVSLFYYITSLTLMKHIVVDHSSADAPEKVVVGQPEFSYNN